MKEWAVGFSVVLTVQAEDEASAFDIAWDSFDKSDLECDWMEEV